MEAGLELRLQQLVRRHAELRDALSDSGLAAPNLPDYLRNTAS